MKNLLYLTLIGVIFVSCDSKPAEETAVEPEIAPSEIEYGYSSSMELRPMDNYEIVRQFYQGIEDQDMDVISSYLADSVSLYFADGSVFNSTKDSAMMLMDGYLANATEIKLIEHAGIVATATDRNEDWVLAWSTEYVTNADGYTSNDVFQENFLIEDGKIRSMRQYIQAIDDSVQFEEVEGFSYSGEFVAGDESLKQVVIDWNMGLSSDSVNYDYLKTLLADTVTVYFADGSVWDKPKVDFLAGVEEIISGYSRINVSFDVLLAARASNTGEDWVLSWTTESFQNAEVEKEEMYIHEDYLIEDGKIRMVRQYQMDIANN